MLRFKARRGAFVVITAIILTSMMAICALAIDFARISALKNELQISADAAAVAGAIQFAPSHFAANHSTAYDSAYAFAHRNKAMQDTVRVDSVMVGGWNDGTKTFTNGGADSNAVRVAVSRQAKGLFMEGFGVTLPRITAKATAWGAAPVGGDGCIKPWAIPYPNLKSRINAYLGIPDSMANLTRAFSQSDYQTLLSMPASMRTFDLHLGSGSVADSFNVSGNYQAVQLPIHWQASTGQTDPYGSPVSGGNSNGGYRDVLSGKVCAGIFVGDSLMTNQGLAGAQNTVDPLSIPHNSPWGICSFIVGYDDGTKDDDPTFGDCRNSNGTVGVSVVASYFLCVTNCSGKSTVAVMTIGAFTVDKIFPSKCGNQAYAAFANCDMAQIQGTFSALAASGKVSNGGASPVTKVILVQ